MIENSIINIKMKNNRITEILGIKYPIVQAPMNWLTNAELVAAVAEAGGIGILGPNAGQAEVTTSPVETAERMRKEFKKVRELTDKPFGTTVLVTGDLTFTGPIIDVLIEEKVPVVLLNGISEPETFEVDYGDIIKKLKDNNIKIIFRPLTPSIAIAKLAEKMGVDIFVATGFDEGGTVPGRIIGTFSIVPMIADAVNIPVMAAGGIADVRTVRAAIALGAEGVFAGSLFLTVKEAPTAKNIKELIINSTAEDLMIFRTLPYYYRSLPSKFAEKLLQMHEAGATREEIAKVQGGSFTMKAGMLDGNTDEGYVSVGNGISMIKEIRTVKEVIEDIMRDFI